MSAHRFTLIATLAAAFMVCGCASTPQKRIEQNPEIFSKLNYEQQAAVQSGKVESGFTPEMVYLSQGEPSEKRRESRAGQEIEVWVYRKPGIAAPAGTNTTGFYGAYQAPQPGTVPHPTPLFYGEGAMVIEFHKGKARRVSGN
jgi:hypothetical protein